MKMLRSIILLGLLMLLIPFALNAQLFNNIELFPQTKIIKGKYFNGCGRGFTSVDYVDSLGRIVVNENYYRGELRSSYKNEYDSHNNKTFEINTFDINDPGTIDTIRYNYTYSGERITGQVVTFSSNISTVTELVESIGDSVLIYKEMGYYFRPNTGKTDVYGKKYTLTYRNGMLVSNEILEAGKTDLSGTVHSLEYTNDLLVNNEVPKNGIEMLRMITFPYRKNNNAREIMTYEYYDNGRLRSTGSDDQYYAYTFDSKGRIKKSFIIIEGKKYKKAAFKYINR